MDVRWEERDVKTAYANAVSAGIAPDEILLRFGMQQSADSIVLSHGIVLNPAIAKQLMFILRQAMAQYSFRGPPAQGAPAPAAPSASADPRTAPILALMERISDQARLPLRLVAGLGAGYALTGSFKMYQGTLLKNRYLMTLAKDRIGEAADRRVLEICRAMGMPEALAAPFAERLKPANYVHFGFEEVGHSCLYKVYMEYWTTWKEELEVKKRAHPFVGGYGYKWDPAKGSRSALTRYTCHPLLPVEAMLERVARLCEAAAGDQPVRVTRGLFDAASRRIPAEKMLYLEADEEGNPRRSFDINLLQAKVLLSELYPLWAGMCEHYAVEPQAFNAMFTPIRNELFAHIQGGVDREGRDFITIYYGSERH